MKNECNTTSPIQVLSNELNKMEEGVIPLSCHDKRKDLKNADSCSFLNSNSTTTSVEEDAAEEHVQEKDQVHQRK